MKILYLTNYQDIQEQISGIVRKLQIVIVVAFVLILWILFAASRWLVSPIGVLTKKMDSYTIEEEIRGIDILRKDEIGSLNRAFVRMSDKLKEAFRRLKAEQEIQKNTDKLNQSEQELADGSAKLEEQMRKLEQERTRAYAELADAQADIDAIRMTKWYVQDRSSISSFSTIQSDADSIETIGTVFPILFLSVAILISLTTITRLVEEERGQIGIYKALGFSDAHVYGKYLTYTLSACICGGLLGDIGGFILMPKFLFMVFDVMYKIPSYRFLFHAGYGICGILLFVAGALIAAICACHSELRQCPAALMRPKAPKAGSRVFLEKIPFLWKRLSFLNKVTFRNLFRYKKRLIMTISGILGCTALLVVGMAIKNSVTDLMPKQYNHIYRYDMMAVVMAEDYDDFTKQIDTDSNISDYLGLQMDTVQAKNESQTVEETVPLYVIPKDTSIADYINLEGLDGKEKDLSDDQIFVTQNLSEVMGFSAGDSLQIQNSDLKECTFSVSGILHNYLGNAIYMRQSTYEALMGDYTPNAILAHLSASCDDPVSYADTLSRESDVVSCSSVQTMRDEFTKSFSLINCVVVLVTALAAGLAFVVLFTLATTNISERERELATIKVLGFFDNEVHLYVNKETLILTVIGIILGLPVGRFFSGLLTMVLKMPSIYFAVSVHPTTYLFAGGMTFLFALAVDFITNRIVRPYQYGKCTEECRITLTQNRKEPVKRVMFSLTLFDCTYARIGKLCKEIKKRHLQ